jgi:hypothetical protein
MKYAHENDTDTDTDSTFEPLGLAAERITHLLEQYFSKRDEKKKEQADDEAAGGGDKQSETDQYREAVDQRLAELASFERRFTKI